MDFIPSSKDELKAKVQNGKYYDIEYLDKDYFNGDELVEKANAKVVVNDDEIMFLVTDPYGMEKFVSNVRLVSPPSK